MTDKLKTEIDVNLLREPDIQMHGLSKADEVYTFYYDETSNVRRLYIREGGLNVPDMGCFALGGVVHSGGKRELDIAGLRSALRLQKGLKEIKFKNLSKGAFPEAIRSKKISTFLEWTLNQDLLAHFFVLDPIYWMVVDVVDGILMEIAEPQLYTLHLALKNDLFAVLRHDRDGTVDLFRRHTSPKRGEEAIKAFVFELSNFIEKRRDWLPDSNFQMLKGVVQMALQLHELPVLNREISNVVIDRFGEFYAKRVCLFKNSAHIFDAEDQVQKFFADHAFLEGGRPLQNYTFSPSENEAGVQISDVMIGLIGRFYSFINRTDAQEIQNWATTLSPVQRDNLAKFSRLLDRSTDENNAFLHYVLSVGDLQRAGILWV